MPRHSAPEPAAPDYHAGHAAPEYGAPYGGAPQFGTPGYPGYVPPDRLAQPGQPPPVQPPPAQGYAAPATPGYGAPQRDIEATILDDSLPGYADPGVRPSGRASVSAAAPAGYGAPNYATPPSAAQPPAAGQATTPWQPPPSRGGWGDRQAQMPPPPRRGGKGLALVRGIGQTFITFGLVILLFAGYEVYGKSWQVDGEQAALSDKLDQVWDKGGGGSAKPNAEPLPGEALARLYIPKLNKRWVVVEGVQPDDIKLAPGHYPDSAQPGQMGNFAVAGHRMPSVFWDLDDMRTGDLVGVETRTDWYVFKVDRVHIIKPTEVGVVAPNPEDPGADPVRKLVTLTTCNPKWDNYERLVVRAVLTKEQPKSKGKPSELDD